MSDYGQKQLDIIRDIGKVDASMHVGCFGCGKTYSIEVALGLLCYRLRMNGLTGLRIVLLGKTQGAVKSNQCDVLSANFGSDFKYDTSKKDGFTKDATLFGQYLYFVGLNDKSSETKFRGISNIFCIVHDEAVLCTEEQFYYISGRDRGKFSKKQMDVFNKLGIVPCFYIGSTNPDSPVHWLKKRIDSGYFDTVTNWNMSDAKWEGSEKYYNRLKKLYKDNPLFTDRYLNGLWVSADGLVWSSFNYKKNVIDHKEYFENEEDINYSGFNRVVIGCDWGSKHNTSFVVLGFSSGVYVALRCLSYNMMAPSDLASELLNLINNIEKTHKIDAVYVDGAGKSYNDELDKLNIQYSLANKSHELIGAVDSAFSKGELFILDNCDKLINGIYGYKYKENAVDDSINRVNDDECDALRYAYISDRVYTDK